MGRARRLWCCSWVLMGVTFGRAAALSRARLLLSCTLRGARERLLLLLLLEASSVRSELEPIILLWMQAKNKPNSKVGGSRGNYCADEGPGERA